MAAPRTAEQTRKANLAKLHVAKKQLCLDDGTYRAMLHEITGKRSSADFTPKEFKAVFAHLGARGWKGAPGGRKYPGRPRNMDGEDTRAGRLKKIEAYLAEAKRPWSYANTLAMVICKIEKIEWVTAKGLGGIIAALRRDAIRHGREPDPKIL